MRIFIYLLLTTMLCSSCKYYKGRDYQVGQKYLMNCYNNNPFMADTIVIISIEDNYVEFIRASYVIKESTHINNLNSCILKQL